MNENDCPTPGTANPAKSARPIIRVSLAIGAILVLGVMIWQGVTAKGAPDPIAPHTSPTAALLGVGVLVFREGLECILVLSAIIASMVGDKQAHRRPVVVGAGVAFLATLVTWFVAVGIINSLAESVSALTLQAATGLLAVIVLLVVMNWFFHKVYWGGWMSLHTRTKTNLLNQATAAQISQARLLWGLGLLGFASVYREGFEVVLFLQSYHLRMGGQVVLGGALLGLFLSGIVAVLTFVAHRRLPYRRMLILTGIMLGFVLIVMVGEQAQEMQLAHWISTTQINRLNDLLPAWMGLWFSIFPTWETLVAQLLAGLLVIGSYFLARHQITRSAPAKIKSRAPRRDHDRLPQPCTCGCENESVPVVVINSAVTGADKVETSRPCRRATNPGKEFTRNEASLHHGGKQVPDDA